MRAGAEGPAAKEARPHCQCWGSSTAGRGGEAGAVHAPRAGASCLGLLLSTRRRGHEGLPCSRGGPWMMPTVAWWGRMAEALTMAV